MSEESVEAVNWSKVREPALNSVPSANSQPAKTSPGSALGAGSSMVSPLLKSIVCV